MKYLKPSSMTNKNVNLMKTFAKNVIHEIILTMRMYINYELDVPKI